MAIVTTAIETVTPNLARAFLEHNTNNRKAHDSTIRKLALDMLAGRWQFTGDPIKFSKSGALLDGQHRLLAVIRSDTPQQFMVVRNLEDEAKTVIDTGKARSLANVLSMRGGTNCAKGAAIVRMAYPFHHGLSIEGWTFSHSVYIDFFDFNAEDIQSAANFVSKNRHLDSLGMTSVWGLVRFATHRADAELSDEFFELMDMPPQVATHPITVLKKLLVAHYKPGKHRVTRTYLFSLICKGWNAFYNQQEVKTIRYATGEKLPVMEGYPYAEATTTTDTDEA